MDSILLKPFAYPGPWGQLVILRQTDNGFATATAAGEAAPEHNPRRFVNWQAQTPRPSPALPSFRAGGTASPPAPITRRSSMAFASRRISFRFLASSPFSAAVSSPPKPPRDMTTKWSSPGKPFSATFMAIQTPSGRRCAAAGCRKRWWAFCHADFSFPASRLSGCRARGAGRSPIRFFPRWC